MPFSYTASKLIQRYFKNCFGENAAAKDVTSCIREVASVDLSSISLKVYRFLSQMDAYPFENFLDDPTSEIRFRLEREYFNVTYFGHWDEDLDVNLPETPYGCVDICIKGSIITVFERKLYVELFSIIDMLDQKQGLKLLMAIERRFDYTDENSSTDQKLDVIFHQMHNGEMIDWICASP